MSEIARLRETILKDYKRYTADDRFTFSCHRQIRCFNKCCADVNIFLTPYDVLRLKKNLGLTSEEFLERYTIVPIDRNQKYPVVMLEMVDSDEKRCPFVSDTEGCTVYDDRPWACRMYPVGLASPKDGDVSENEFYFLMEESHCEGFGEDKEWTIREWIENQGIQPYNEMGDRFKEVAMHEFFQQDKELDPKKLELFFLVCYNLDAFRRFVFESRFLEMFEVEKDVQERIREDDAELLTFGLEWLKFSLFGQQTMTIKPSVLEAKKKELGRTDNGNGSAGKQQVG